jgi:hypothetical protein
MNARRWSWIATSMVLLAAPSAASAAAPSLVPIQGFLTDAAGIPVDGTAQFRISFYATASAPADAYLFRETQVVTVDHGAFLLLAGSIGSLDLALFRDNGAAFVGVQVGSDPEMTPRLTVGTTPYAGYAEYAGDSETLQGLNPADFAPSETGVPAGAVMHFDLAACPPGWSELTAARGRTIMALTAGGTVGGTVGTPLGDLENRTHSHNTSAATATSAASGSHAHTVDVGTITSSTASGHTHGVTVPDHNHEWARFTLVAAPDDYEARSYNSAGTQTTVMFWGNGIDEVGAGIYPFAFNHDTGGPPGPYYTNNAGSAGLTSTTAGSHSHTVPIGTLTSSSATTHTHSVTIPASTSNTAATSDVVPYIQLIACRKD